MAVAPTGATPQGLAAAGGGAVCSRGGAGLTHPGPAAAREQPGHVVVADGGRLSECGVAALLAAGVHVAGGGLAALSCAA